MLAACWQPYRQSLSCGRINLTARNRGVALSVEEKASTSDTIQNERITPLSDRKLLASDAATNDLFGRSVAISGLVAVVGASGSRRLDDIQQNTGAVYVYTRVASGWTEQPYCNQVC